MRIKQNLFSKKYSLEITHSPSNNFEISYASSEKNCRCERYVMIVIIFLATGCIRHLEKQRQAKSSPIFVTRIPDWK